MRVRFNYKLPEFRIRNALRHRRWLERVLSDEKLFGGIIDIVFTDDNEILDINRQFLKHNYFTDVITFNYDDNESSRGEIYISVDSVRSNAGIYNESAASEFRRVMVHGVLHLCGYKDSTAEEAAGMRRLEDTYLSLYKNEFHI